MSYAYLNYLIYQTRAWNFVLRKLKFGTIYYAYLNELPFKYYISILGGVGKPCLYNTSTLPNQFRHLLPYTSIFIQQFEPFGQFCCNFTLLKLQSVIIPNIDNLAVMLTVQLSNINCNVVHCTQNTCTVYTLYNCTVYTVPLHSLYSPDKQYKVKTTAVK